MYGSRDNSDIIITSITVIAVIIGAVIGFSKCNGGDHKSAEHEFRKWAKDLRMDYDGMSCNGHDSDGDGYVSCTYMVNGEPHTVECAGAFNMQHGCRTPKPVLRASTTVINNSRR